MQLLNEIRPINLREQVVEQVKTAIIEGQLKPGDHMVEASLTKQLGVSRTPLREALILLEREGLVESFPNRGTCEKV
jgi:GntR family transcriptional regulator, rspAB operon transcriptional repressor